MKKYYVALTGSKNNAGDYLIKYRAKRLLNHLRPDRDIVDVDAWLAPSQETLDIMNKAEAILLLGGPALRHAMVPDIYKVLGDISLIKAPIIPMGVGWRVSPGEWYQTQSYTFNKQTHALLTRIDKSGFASSVRDYHSLNALLQNGYKNVMMTGCPALYDIPHLNSKVSYGDYPIRKVSYSLGVSYIEEPAQEKIVKDQIVSLRKYFRDAQFQVVFHHTLRTSESEKAYGAQHSVLVKKYLEMEAWLKTQNIDYIDISGSAENLIEHYSQCDLHIGYRVHAHIFMSSTNRASILIAEDGRGKALKDVINGVNLESHFSSYRELMAHDLITRINRRFKLYGKASNLNTRITDELLDHIKYEVSQQFPRMSTVRNAIDNHFGVMQRFVKQLP